VIWIIFLRYLLARKAIETQADVEKYRLQLEIMGSNQNRPLIESAARPRLSLPGRDVADTAQSDKDNPLS